MKLKKNLEKLVLTGILTILPFFGCEVTEPEELRYGNVIGKVIQPYITEDERVAYKPYPRINVAIPSINRTTATDSLGNFDFREVEEGIYEVQANSNYGVLSKAIDNNGGYFDERYQTIKREVNVLGEEALEKSIGKSVLQSSIFGDTLEIPLIPQIGYPRQILHGFVFNKNGSPYKNYGLNLYASLSPLPQFPKYRISFLHPEEMTENKGRYAFYIGDDEYYFLKGMVKKGDNYFVNFFEFDTTTSRKYLSAYVDSLGIIEADAFLIEDEQGEDEQ